MNMRLGFVIVFAAALLGAGFNDHAAAQSKARGGRLTITNGLTENQNLLQITLERRLPNGKTDSSRDSVTKGRTKTLNLPFGSYSVRLSRMKISGTGPLYEVWTTKEIEINESTPEHTLNITESDLSPRGTGGTKGKKGAKN